MRRMPIKVYPKQKAERTGNKFQPRFVGPKRPKNGTHMSHVSLRLFPPRTSLEARPYRSSGWSSHLQDRCLWPIVAVAISRASPSSAPRVCGASRFWTRSSIKGRLNGHLSIKQLLLRGDSCSAPYKRQKKQSPQKQSTCEKQVSVNSDGL